MLGWMTGHLNMPLLHFNMNSSIRRSNYTVTKYSRLDFGVILEIHTGVIRDKEIKGVIMCKIENKKHTDVMKDFKVLGRYNVSKWRF